MGPSHCPFRSLWLDRSLRQPPVGSILDRTALRRGPAKRGTGRSWKVVAFITGRFESPSEREACFSTTKTTLVSQQDSGKQRCAPLGFVPLLFPEKSQGFCGGSLRQSQGPAALQLCLQCGAASVTYSRGWKRVDMLLSHKETVVSILGLSLTLSGVTWPGQLGPALCASLWSGQGGNTAGVSVETAIPCHCKSPDVTVPS